jgi:predicted transposase YbfD/YdcC
MTLVDLIIFDQVAQINQESLVIEPASLYQAFEQVKDGRGKKGKRYPLPLILTLIMLGKMVGQTKIDGIITWIDERKKEMRKLLNWPKSFPSHKTYVTALSKCDGREVAKVIAQVIVKARAIKQVGNEPSRLVVKQEQKGENLIHTAMDGKAMRGTREHEYEHQPEVNVLSLYECETGIVLAQETYKNQGYEQSTGLAILHPSLVKGRIITADALHSHRKFCAKIHVYRGYYLMPIKDNNPAVLRDIIEFFEDEGIDRKEFQYYKDVQKGHGRLEVREIWTSTQMNEWFAQDWAGIAQVYKIKKTVIEKGEEVVKVSYGITNLPRKKANAERLLKLKRRHWTIENRLHYRRDVTLGEDASQVRIKGAPAVLAALNGGILALSDFLGIKNLAQQMIHYCAQPQEALQLLLGNLSLQNG